ncbi:hypothetical protein [Pontibacter anaerobius]|uniref:Uncharacterized protein n=1 Tax=Pontibacter anaerobius TaxID=2993940 RepID=A0ABT3RDY0_9BACT|nr:hypothetical protein [Pontibacter anaerobius]MCX2739582.1 hypothetical protein [Pontibacter anaerobius]
MKESLSNTDRWRIWLEIKQDLVGYAATGLVRVILTVALIIFFLQKGVGTDRIALLVLLLCLASVGGLFLLIRRYLLDLFNGTKYVYLGKITDKATRTHWGWHGNPAADATSQPNVTEFVLAVDEKEVKTEQSLYELLGIGDNVWVHIAPVSRLILALRRENA